MLKTLNGDYNCEIRCQLQRDRLCSSFYMILPSLAKKHQQQKMTATVTLCWTDFSSSFNVAKLLYRDDDDDETVTIHNKLGDCRSVLGRKDFTNFENSFAAMLCCAERSDFSVSWTVEQNAKSNSNWRWWWIETNHGLKTCNHWKSERSFSLFKVVTF